MARRIVAGLALISAVTLALAPMAAAGGRFHGGAAGGRGFVGRPFASHPFVHHPFVHHPFVARPFFPHHFFRPFVPFGVGVAVVVPPVYAYAGPPAYDAGSPYSDASSYYPPPVAYAPPAGGTVSVVPSPRPMQTVVEYPNGRYELRGDGVTTPYRWVWIPNPPPPPGDPPSGRQSRLYRWLDGEGTVHWTDSLDSVPKQYRAQAKQGQS